MATRSRDDDYADERSTVGLDRRGGDGSLRLRVIGESQFASHPLPAHGRLVIGRSREADVRIDHESVSRKHAVLFVGAQLRIEDLGSQNGTKVRGRALAIGETAEIEPNEVIELGGLLLLVQRGAAPSVAHKEPPGGAMHELERVIARIAAGNISVLLLGETGAGKEVMAERIHALSPRAKKPLVRLHCGALPEALLESELFGHKKGAFTGADQSKPGLLETAQGGTVLLDEIGELPPAIQVKLLRVLDSRQILPVGGLAPKQLDVRFIAATNRDLEAEVARGAFRQDLFFRLSGISLTVPPLRERRSEIEPLARRFLAESGAKVTLSPEALERLLAYSWPGNVRELRNAVERAALLSTDGVIRPEQLPLAAEPAPPSPPRPPDERQRILDALAASGGNQTEAARALGISRNTLAARLVAHDIPRPRKRR
jgi:transcriptional regulator of acetoin/glycerol metabolism